MYKRQSAALAWCNGRSVARGFYERHGFEVRGEEFVIEGVGPHFVFTIKLPAAEGADAAGDVGGGP